jgi:hypothetical protein
MMATAGGIQGYFKEAEPQGRWINNPEHVNCQRINFLVVIAIYTL